MPSSTAVATFRGRLRYDSVPGSITTASAGTPRPRSDGSTNRIRWRRTRPPTDGYTLVGASLGYRWQLGGQVLDLLLRGRNLTDEDSYLKDVAPLPGRNVTLSAKLRF